MNHSSLIRPPTLYLVVRGWLCMYVLVCYVTGEIAASDLEKRVWCCYSPLFSSNKHYYSSNHSLHFFCDLKSQEKCSKSFGSPSLSLSLQSWIHIHCHESCLYLIACNTHASYHGNRYREHNSCTWFRGIRLMFWVGWVFWGWGLGKYNSGAKKCTIVVLQIAPPSYHRVMKV